MGYKMLLDAEFFLFLLPFIKLEGPIFIGKHGQFSIYTGWYLYKSFDQTEILKIVIA